MFRRLFNRLFNSQSIDVNDVFTPTRAAELNYIQRPLLEKQVLDAIKIPGKQLLLFGHSGSGKTTIIRSLLDSQRIKYTKVHCERTSTFSQILLTAFDNLDKYIVSERSFSDSRKDSARIASDYKLIKSEISSEQTSTESCRIARLIPVQLTPQKLAQFYGEGSFVLIIEDFHKVSDEEKARIADLLKIFVDNANDFKLSKIICIGACDSPNELVKLDPNLRNRVAETKITMLTDEEIRKIVTNGCQLLNIEMEEPLIDKLVYYSARLGSAAHQMCLDICLAEGITQKQKKKIVIKDKAFNHAVSGFLKYNEGTLSSIYELAVKDELGWYILKTVSRNSHKKLSCQEIFRIVNKSKRTFSYIEIKAKLDDFCRPPFSVLYFNSDSEKYSIASPFWDAFLRMQFAYEAANKEAAGKNIANKNLKLVRQNNRDASVENYMLELLLRLRKQRDDTIIDNK